MSTIFLSCIFTAITQQCVRLRSSVTPVYICHAALRLDISEVMSHQYRLRFYRADRTQLGA
jgi:hypothetical protein